MNPNREERGPSYGKPKMVVHLTLEASDEIDRSTEETMNRG